MYEKRPRLLTGVQPSGDLHIGNYFGAIKPFIELCDDHEGFFMVADYHALTSVSDATTLWQGILNTVKDCLAAGLDSKEIVFFRQSDNPDHLELAWIFNCLVTVPFLSQSHAYKDKVVKGVEASAGLFTYPMLQAADIALYKTDIVPVGEDQRQHLEYAREVIGKFNRTWSPLLKEPKEKIDSSVQPGTDGEKMSKSRGNVIPMFGSQEAVRKAVMSIVTDSVGEHPANVYAIHKLLRSEDYLSGLYNEHKGKYGFLKEKLVEDLEELLVPMRKRREEISDEEVFDILKEGKDKARAISEQTNV